MDFWSRLLAHTSLTPSGSRKDAARDPARRLHRFEKEYGQILQIWRNASNLTRDVDAAERIEVRIQELTNILADESRRPLPHPCIQFAAAKQIYSSIAKIAMQSYNEWIIKETVLFFATLIETEEEGFVERDTFAASLTNLLVRITGINSVRLGSDTETRVVEVAFNITTKIRLEPRILSAWFKTPGQQQTQDATIDRREKFAGRTQRQDFPLFYVLMDYIHHDGKVGDFARTGLLYIIESASSSVELEQWIVESDLSTLMATGLGALYSQLSRKLVIDHPSNELPPVLALSDYQHPTSSYEIVSSCSPDFQQHLETFLSHLLFWQDVLNHCRSIEVKSTLLEHFQVIFLQQLLYPSLLESSDIDGGSSVAVLTYLRRILESLDHPDMINLILHYLLALPDTFSPEASQASIRTSVSAARKRKSMDLLTMMSAKSDLMATPMLFNLVDLILACLRSQNQQTIHVTLQLVSAILKRHHRYAVITLLRTEGVHSEASHRTVGAHQQEVEYLMALAGVVGGQDNFDEIYDNVLKDTMTKLEGHPCSLKLVAPKVSTNNHKLPAIPDSLPGAPRDVRTHTLRPDDPLLNSVLDILETFFVNPVETNLSMTETVVDLAVCGYMHVEGWFLRHPQKYVYENAESNPDSPDAISMTFSSLGLPPEPGSADYEEYQKLLAMENCRRRPTWTPSTLPRMLAVLERLTKQVSTYRDMIPRFDDLLQLRREAFQTADTVAATPAPPPRKTTPLPQNSMSTPDRTSLEEISRSGSPARPSGLEGFAQRLLGEFGSPSRSGSPRGRKDFSNKAAFGTPTLSSAGGGSRAVPIVPPKEFPLNYDNPSRSGLSRSYSPSSGPSSVREDGGSSFGGREGVVASQAAAFAAVDQSILARRIGIPGKVQAIPLNFNKRIIPSPSNSSASTPRPGKTDADESALVDAEGLTPKATRDGREKTFDLEVDTEGEETEPTTPDESLGAVKPPVTPPEERTVTVSHVLTNVIIFQSFLFELASVVQVRAGLFDEVRFT